MDGVYYFGEFLRWDLGFPNPNVAGALIAVFISFLIPLTTEFPKNKLARALFISVFTVEIALWFLLAKTYSRGAFVSATLCQAVGIALFFRQGISRQILPSIIFKITLVSIIIYSTGFFARMSPGYVKSDASVGARMELWQGGLEMLAQAPINGCGGGKSGTEYINWYQNLNDGRRYAGMVNGYLLVAAERGLPALYVLLFPFAFLISAGLSLPPRAFRLAVGGALGLLSFLISNFFSSLLVFKVFWWTMAALSAFPLFYLLKAGLNCAIRSFAFAVFACSAFCAVGYIAALQFCDGQIRKFSGFVRIQSDEKANPDRKIAVFVDKSVLGEYCGKTLRHAVALSAGNISVDVFRDGDYRELLNEVAGYDIVILCGNRASLSDDDVLQKSKIALLNPVGIPKTGRNRPLCSYLPGLDVFNQTEIWRRHFEKFNLKYRLIEYSSQQISAEELAKILDNDWGGLKKPL